ncbi:OLC1v1019289C1 [Oldenlandia corymbosa var. corymbosa]|uniref:OLC1v1019289C1 n=1 Tax=Oldenlandia corymbosa var. corymbosa TaxID=529605 RepID=A0AAV1EDP0_OLDCO|nr:OLC1v1019289C1 [Oldenlandia corymbosa var. corymbosa]
MAEDRISDLPDAIISRILSYLPTEQPWIALFQSIPDLELDFDDSLLRHDPNGEPFEGNPAFVNCVGGVLSRLLEINAKIRGFKLKVHKKYENDEDGGHCNYKIYSNCRIIGSWLHSAASLGVQFVSLDVSFADSKELLSSLDGCITLEKLQFTERLDFSVSGLPRVMNSVDPFGHNWNIPDGCYARFLSSIPIGVPFYLTQHLKKIKIQKFSGWEDEIDFMVYLLRNGKVLQEVSFFGNFGFSADDQLVLERFQAAITSTTCQIRFFRN